MTSAQTRLYWSAWAEVKARLPNYGFASDELDQKRHAIHIEAIGHDKSSKSLTNTDFDAVLAAFRAYSDPDNLHEQLRIIDQAEKRAKVGRERAEQLMAAIGVGEHVREAYLDTLARRVCKHAWCDLSDVEQARVCGVLGAKAARK